MSKEAMKLALEALEDRTSLMKWQIAREALREALAEQPAQQCRTDGRCQYAIDSGAEGMGHCPKGKCVMPAQQEPVAWKLVPTEPTEEMLKAMDECSKEGYDERLYAGHAASVYMAAVDAAPEQPAQRTWVGLTDEQIDKLFGDGPYVPAMLLRNVARAIEAKLKEKNR